MSVVSSFGSSVILDGPVLESDEAIPFTLNGTKLTGRLNTVPTRAVHSGTTAHLTLIKQI